MANFDAHGTLSYSTVLTAPSPATSGTSLVVQSGNGALFPTPPFNCTVWPASSNPTTTNAEIVRVTAVSTDTFTIARMQEGTSAISIATNYQIANTATVKTFTDIENNMVQKLATITGINGKTVATTALYTVPAGKTAYITNLILSSTAATAITGGPTASAGYTASAYADLYASATITALQAAGTAFGFSSVGMFETIPAGSVINLNITNGSTGTSQTLAADLIGFIR